MHIDGLSNRNLGLKNLPDTATEADILVAYVWGDSIRIALTEVKNITQYPWGSAELPDRQNNSKAILQLEKDLKLFDSLLEDLPADKLSFQLFSAFPSCKQEDLEKIFCSICMKSVINQNDTSSPANMVNKLEVDGPIPTATDEGKELLLTLVSRLTGQASKLHLMNRLTTDKARREMARHETNVDFVDQKINTHQYVILSDKQKQIVNQVHQSPHFTIRGRAGSGKTLLCIALARAMAAKDKNTVLIMTSGYDGMGKSAPTMTHMANQVKPGKAGGGGGIFNSMKKLFGLNFDQTDQITNKVIIEDMKNVLQLLNMDINSFEIRSGVYNYPALLSALAQSAVQEYGNVVIAVDELRTMYAPEKQVGGTTHYDWTALGQIKGPVRIVLAFNPQSVYPILLPDDQSFCHVESELRYRSTISITKMVDMMAVHTLYDKCVVTQDTAASDVAGSLPYVKDLGRFSSDLVESAVSMIKQSMTDQQNNTAVTLLYGVGLSDKMKDKIRDLGTLYGWPVYYVAQFAGWEGESIIYVGPGQMEALSRAKLHTFVLLGYEEEEDKKTYELFRDGFVQAEKEGLVKMGN